MRDRRHAPRPPSPPVLWNNASQRSVRHGELTAGAAPTSSAAPLCSRRDYGHSWHYRRGARVIAVRTQGRRRSTRSLLEARLLEMATAKNPHRKQPSEGEQTIKAVRSGAIAGGHLRRHVFRRAAGVGFEPTSDLDGHCRFSRPVRSTAPPPRRTTEHSSR